MTVLDCLIFLCYGPIFFEILDLSLEMFVYFFYGFVWVRVQLLSLLDELLASIDQN